MAGLMVGFFPHAAAAAAFSSLLLHTLFLLPPRFSFFSVANLCYLCESEHSYTSWKDIGRRQAEQGQRVDKSSRQGLHVALRGQRAPINEALVQVLRIYQACTCAEARSRHSARTLVTAFGGQLGPSLE